MLYHRVWLVCSLLLGIAGLGSLWQAARAWGALRPWKGLAVMGSGWLLFSAAAVTMSGDSLFRESLLLVGVALGVAGAMLNRARQRAEAGPEKR